MQTTTNYGFSIAEGSDSVNLLTQLYPNFTSLDGILLPIQNNGTTPATHTKAGTVHQLVRTTTGCSVLRFVATGNYNAGDTFTVDGASVTATSCNGQSLPAGAFVINQSVMAILNGAVLTVLAGGSSEIQVDASDVDYDNTDSGLTATNVQDAIDEVKADIPSIPATYQASAITYDNTVTSMTATNVQAAIDELYSLIGSSKPHPVTGVVYHTTGSSYLVQDGVTYSYSGGAITVPNVITFTYTTNDSWNVLSFYDCTVTLNPGSSYTLTAGVTTSVQGSTPSSNVTVVFT